MTRGGRERVDAGLQRQGSVGWGGKGDMDDERDKHRETFCFASLCYVRDHSSTDVQSRHCPSRATTVAVHKSCGGCHANAFVMPEWRPRQSLSSKSVSSEVMLLGPKIMLPGKKVTIVGRRRPERRKSLLGYA